MDILQDIAWAFNDKDYPAIADFNQEINRYQEHIMQHKTRWDPEAIVVDFPRVSVIYEYWAGANDPVFEDEQVSGDNEEQKDVMVTFKADNGQYFTASELLYKLHMRLRQRELGDHIFFEGLTAAENREAGTTPVFYLYCGS